MTFLGSLYKQYQASFTQSDKSQIGYNTDVSVMEERHLYNTY